MRSRFTSMFMLLLGVTNVGCLLERVTGEEIPLDPRFYAAVEGRRNGNRNETESKRKPKA